MSTQVMTLEEMQAKIGTELGTTDWFTMDQERINQFADCTNDHQWIHVDIEAAAKGPFGAPIAHGYLTVSLISHFAEGHMPLPEGAVMAVNYGMNKLRLLNPVTVGSQIRDRIELLSIEDKGNGRILACAAHTIEIKGQEKPALYAEALVMFFTA